MLENLALVLGLAAVGGLISQALKQPAMVGYILVGAVLAAVGKFDLSFVGSLGQLGITLLLFLVGLELPIPQLLKIGRTALITGISQITVTVLAGFGLAVVLGIAATPAFYVGLALTFGSTVMVVKLLSEKRDLASLYGRIAIGFLLVQDFVAIVILIGLSDSGNLGLVAVRGILLFLVAIILSTKILPKVFAWIGKSTEVLFVVSLGWCLGVAAVVSRLGLSIEIGGFLAGLALASTAQNLQIVSRIRPLRDFFITLFFVSLGANLNTGFIGYLILPAIILSIFVLVGNPLIVMWILGLQGYHKHVGFMAGTTVAQVSEFSLILLGLAASKGLIGNEVVSLVALVAIITMTISTYLITHAGWVYRKICKFLWVYHLVKPENLNLETQMTDHVVLFGHNRTGSVIRPELESLGEKVLVVDFDPEAILQIKSDTTQSLYGDMGDYELYANLHLDRAKAIISTVSDIENNLELLAFLKNMNTKPLTIVTAVDETDAEKLYTAGANYVLVPHSVGGDFLVHLLRKRGFERGNW